jgi:hypothetical protein
MLAGKPARRKAASPNRQIGRALRTSAGPTNFFALELAKFVVISIIPKRYVKDWARRGPRSPMARTLKVIALIACVVTFACVAHGLSLVKSSPAESTTAAVELFAGHVDFIQVPADHSPIPDPFVLNSSMDGIEQEDTNEVEPPLQSTVFVFQAETTPAVTTRRLLSCVRRQTISAETPRILRC